MLFYLFTQEAPKELISDAFSKNLMRCLINQLADGDRYLHRTALKCLKAMQARVEEAPETAYEFVAGLTGSCGSPLFDQITKTKTVVTLLTKANDMALQRIISLFDSIIQKPSGDETKVAESHRRALADLLVSAIRSRKLEGSVVCVRSVLKMFSKYGYLKTQDPTLEPIPPLSSVSRETFRTRLSACFAHLMSMQATLNMNWPFEIIHYLKSEEEFGRFEMIMGFDTKIEEARRSAWKKMSRLDKMVSRLCVFSYVFI